MSSNSYNSVSLIHVVCLTCGANRKTARLSNCSMTQADPPTSLSRERFHLVASLQKKNIWTAWIKNMPLLNQVDMYLVLEY
jgi:hypothetical protein